MNLVDEDDDVAARADLLRDLLEALFEVTAVAAAGDERAEVERVQLLVLERLGHFALDDRLREALDDGGLADAGLADEDGVVLGAAGEDLHDPLRLLLAPDDGVELALARSSGEVATELVENLRALVGVGAVAADGDGLLALVAAQQLDDLLAHAVEVGAELDEHLGSDALALADEAEKDVLGADVVVAELQGLAQRELEHLLGERDIERLERLRGDSFALVDEAEQNVLCADVVVVEHLGLFLGQHHHTTGTVGEPFEHLALSSRQRVESLPVHRG